MQPEESAGLREERDGDRRIILEHLKTQFADPKEWEQFNENEYSLTVDDLLAVINAP